jgi:histidinol-phosphate aminotransferase
MRLHEFPNLVITQTLSKAYGMAGIRLGICMASPEIIAILNKIKPPYNVNELTQQRALERVLELDIIASEVTEILDERERLAEVLHDISFVKKIYPSDANFILAKVDDANRRYDQILNKGFVVRNRSTQPLCENTLRFTIGTPNENKELIAVLKSLE